MSKTREEVERTFEGWLRWSSDGELLLLLGLVVGQLRSRRYSVTSSVQPPQPEK